MEHVLIIKEWQVIYIGGSPLNWLAIHSLTHFVQCQMPASVSDILIVQRTELLVYCHLSKVSPLQMDYNGQGSHRPPPLMLGMFKDSLKVEMEKSFFYVSSSVECIGKYLLVEIELQ